MFAGPTMRDCVKDDIASAASLLESVFPCDFNGSADRFVFTCAVLDDVQHCIFVSRTEFRALAITFD